VHQQKLARSCGRYVPKLKKGAWQESFVAYYAGDVSLAMGDVRRCAPALTLEEGGSQASLRWRGRALLAERTCRDEERTAETG
jgi:hypothetical protein